MVKAKTKTTKKTTAKTAAKTSVKAKISVEAQTSVKTKASANPKKKVTIKHFYQKFLDRELKLKAYQKVGVAFLIVVFSGNIGWIYEVLLNWIAHGHFYMKGGNFLPWMNIYAIGAVAIIPATYRLRRYPWAVFVVSAIVAGLIELTGGWLVYQIWHARYWDYSDAWWGFGNINGFVCPVSVTAFGIGALALVYGLLPLCIKIALNMKKRAFLALSITLFTLVMTDELTNLTLKCLDLPTAMNFWESIGLKYR